VIVERNARNARKPILLAGVAAFAFKGNR
jgi:hypothetical protein